MKGYHYLDILRFMIQFLRFLFGLLNKIEHIAKMQWMNCPVNLAGI